MTLAGPSLKEQWDDLIGKLNPGGIIGIDIGAHSIKVCELSGSTSNIKVERFGVFTLSEAAIIEDEVQKPDEVAQGIIETLKKANINSKQVCLGLSGPNTMTKRLSTPEGTKEEIEDHVMWEVEQYITFGADESIIDFHVIGENEGGGKDVLVAAAKIELIDRFKELLKDAKLQLKLVDLNVLALSNIFEAVYSDKLEEFDNGTLLLDFGAQTTKIVVYKRGAPIFTKEIPLGGGMITEENGNLPEEILKIIDAQIDQQLAEVKKNINFYISQGSTEKVDYCFITGGSSLLPGLPDKFSVMTGLEVQRLDVLSAIKIDQRKVGRNEELFTAISPVVLGLAMRKFSK
jgi:type IV pilus assembly protein PilM